jgi:hypothetical protein
MDENIWMRFEVMSGLPLELQIEDFAGKVFVDDFGVSPTVCEVPEQLAVGLPESIETMEVRVFQPDELESPNEYWVGID